MTSAGSVRDYHADEGWGVIDGPDVPGGCWVHFGNSTAYRSTLTLTFDAPDPEPGDR